MKAFFLIYFLLISWALQAQTYYVIHLNGQILNEKTKKDLRIGDKLDSKDKVKFKTDDSKAVLMNSQRGRFVIEAKAGQTEKEMTAYLNTIIMPLKNNIQLSVRSTQVSDLKAFFGNENFAIIGEEMLVELDIKNYPIKSDKMFLFRYLTQNGDTVERPIRTDRSWLAFNKNDLFRDDKFSQNQAVQIWYFDIYENKYDMLASFKLQFLNENELLQELSASVELLKNSNLTDQELKYELITIVSDLYGKTDPNYLDNWLTNKRLIK